MERAKIEAFAGKARNLLKQQIGARIALLRKSESSSVVIENKSAMAALEKRISEKGLETVVDEVAYTWFNRLCALRYMDAHDFNKTLVVTPLEGNVLPEILSDAMTGNLDTKILTRSNEDRINKLLSGEIRSNNAQAEIYRILLVSKCNVMNKDIPMLFERISDYTDLLLPEDLLSKDAIIPMMRDALTDENCEAVEVIGWLYQYYIAEKKDEVFAGFKKGKKATAKEIPAATQLFTPEWIVRYLVENSLGRLWMLNHPESRLIEKMEYYIKPVDVEPDFIKIASPEEIKVCDPCCGSGHMLTYSFDILFEIYSELGYTAKDAVEHIIRDNLYGIELDDRAGQLAYFALMMKAREKARRFFSLGVEPNICVLHNVSFDEEELRVACGLFSNTRDSVVRNLLTQFEHADTFGSLIVPYVDDIAKLKANLTKTTRTDDLFDVSDTVDSRVNEVLRYTEYLSSKYQVVITNPPYMRNYNDITKIFITKNYPDSKSDLCTAFMERNWKLAVPYGYSAIVNMHSWMFLGSFKKLRPKMLHNNTILSLVHIGPRGFDSIGGEVVSTVAFVSQNTYIPGYKAIYKRLVEFIGEKEKIVHFFDTKSEYIVDSASFASIAESPIAYFASSAIFKVFNNAEPIGSRLKTCQGLATGANGLFLRYWYEISTEKMSLNSNSLEMALLSKCRWFPITKGGEFRKWYGNNEFVVDWENNGSRIKNYPGSVIRNEFMYFSPGLTWSTLSNSMNMRSIGHGFLSESKGSKCMISDFSQSKIILGYFNSKPCSLFLKFLAPTLDFHEGPLSRVPYISVYDYRIEKIVDACIELARQDWDSFETSWDFSRHPLSVSKIKREEGLSVDMDSDSGKQSATLISNHYEAWEKTCYERFNQLKMYEEELNRIFIDVYELQEELTPEVEDADITVRKADLNRDVRSFVSYAVGCMFGRYSLDVDGLVFAGGTWDSTNYNSLVPDEDNVIPVLSDEWFTDDIVFRFRDFVRVCFGEKTLTANMRFIENALGMNIRSYFMKEFYKDHLKVYQKRPIYWMFSSPKGYFNALVYLHRYHENTASVVLGHLRQFRAKLSTEIGALERENNNRNAKTLVNYRKIAEDLDDYERILYPIAMENIALDLDDGVKVNYGKLWEALKKVPGLENAE